MRETHTAGEIRRSQMVQIYGPGAIINLKYQQASISVVMCDLRMWEYKSTALSKLAKDQKFADTRLSKKIKSKYGLVVDYYRLPPIEPEDYRHPNRQKAHLVGFLYLAPQRKIFLRGYFGRVCCFGAEELVFWVLIHGWLNKIMM